MMDIETDINDLLERAKGKCTTMNVCLIGTSHLRLASNHPAADGRELAIKSMAEQKDLFCFKRNKDSKTDTQNRLKGD